MEGTNEAELSGAVDNLFADMISGMADMPDQPDVKIGKLGQDAGDFMASAFARRPPRAARLSLFRIRCTCARHEAGGSS